MRKIYLIIVIFFTGLSLFGQEIIELNNGEPLLPSNTQHTIFYEESETYLYIAYTIDDSLVLQFSTDGGTSFQEYQFTQGLDPDNLTPVFFYKGQYVNPNLYVINSTAEQDQLLSIELSEGVVNETGAVVIDTVESGSSFEFIDKVWTSRGRLVFFYKAGTDVRYFVLNQNGEVEAQETLIAEVAEINKALISQVNSETELSIQALFHCNMNVGNDKIYIINEKETYPFEIEVIYSAHTELDLLSINSDETSIDGFLFIEQGYLVFANFNSTIGEWDFAQIQTVPENTSWGFIEDGYFGFWEADTGFVYYSYDIDEYDIIQITYQEAFQYNICPMVISIEDTTHVIGIEHDVFRSVSLLDRSVGFECENAEILTVKKILFVSPIIVFIQQNDDFLDLAINTVDGLPIYSESPIPKDLLTDYSFEGNTDFLKAKIVIHSPISLSNTIYAFNSRQNHFFEIHRIEE